MNSNPFKTLRRSNRGETLIYTIIVIAILIIVGSALATFAVMSVRISTLQHASEKAFYLSDAAIEETLTQLESRLKLAETNALEKVNNTSIYYGQAKWVAFLERINQDILNGLMSTAEASDRIKAATNAEFIKQYHFELFGRPLNETWLKEDYTLIDETGHYVSEPMPIFNELSLAKDAFKDLEAITLDPTLYDGYEKTNKPLMAVESILKDNRIQLKLTSTGTFNRYKKPVVVNVSLVPPDYTQVITNQNRSVTVSKNDILTYGLVARNDLIVTDGAQNSVNGNVYSYGTFPETGNYRIGQLGGVLLGYSADSHILTQTIGDFKPSQNNSSGSLNINGNLYTRSAVKLFNNSRLSVTGNVYANALTFDKNTKDAEAIVHRNVYLYEDLYLAGENPNLTVGESTAKGDGLLWGIMQHQVNLSNQIIRSDMSSSIIVDSDAIKPRITVNSAYIAGVAYFNVFVESEGTRHYYQSGESFTTNNNFYFYDTKSPGNTSLTTSAVAYKDENDNLYYLYEALDANGKVVSNVQFKADVFYQGGLKDPASISAADRSIFNVRSIRLDSEGDVIGLENNYALGVIIANSRVIDPYPKLGGGGAAPKSEYSNDAVFQDMKRKALKAADQWTSLLSTRNYSNNLNQDPNATTKSRLGEFINWPSNAIVRTTNPKAVVVISPELDANVYVNIPDDLVAGIKATEPNSIFITEGNGAYRNMTGVIAANGNIVVYNNTSNQAFNFTGTIISNGSIVLKGPGAKNFNYNETSIYSLISFDEVLNRIFSLETGKRLALRKVNGADSSSENGSLTFDVASHTESLTLTAGQVPESGGMMKKPTEFSFKINSWFISD